jgi:hypothetical protein
LEINDAKQKQNLAKEFHLTQDEMLELFKIEIKRYQIPKEHFEIQKS